MPFVVAANKGGMIDRVIRSYASCT